MKKGFVCQKQDEAFCLFLAECEFLVCKFEFTAIDQHHVCAAVDDLSAEVGVVG